MCCTKYVCAISPDFFRTKPKIPITETPSASSLTGRPHIFFSPTQHLSRTPTDQQTKRANRQLNSKSIVKMSNAPASLCSVKENLLHEIDTSRGSPQHSNFRVNLGPAGVVGGKLPRFRVASLGLVSNRPGCRQKFEFRPDTSVLVVAPK